MHSASVLPALQKLLRCSASSNSSPSNSLPNPAVDTLFVFSSRRRHTRLQGDWSSDVCSSDLDLARPYWGQGLMTEAVRAMIQFGFEHMGLNRIEAEVMPENIASIRFLSKLGFEEEDRKSVV